MLNNVNLCGRLTADPEIRFTQSGTPVASFTLAVDGNTKEKSTDFIRCVAWQKTAEFIRNYFSKGKMMIVSGRISTREYEKDGAKRFVTEVTAERVFFAGDRQGDAPKSTDDYKQINEDDLPFDL